MYRKDTIGLQRERQASLHELAGLLGLRPREPGADPRHPDRSPTHLPYHAIVSPLVRSRIGIEVRR